MKLDFYNVDRDYIAYLQQAEFQKRGFTRVPNVDYESGKQKFICGIVFEAPQTRLKYFVGVTHYRTQKSENFLLIVENDRVPVKGSLRFNYMFPVPTQMVTRKDISGESDMAYKILLSKELKAVNEHADEILSQAHSVYNKIVNRTCSENLLLNSCDFTYLEEKCVEFCKLRSLDLPFTDKEKSVEQNEEEIEHTPWNDILVASAQKSKAKKVDRGQEHDR